ncbi:hypothetical protein J7K28_08765, partial [Candidatus Aerophobetes bacterium]|nr:hypothetical protein [Candidatus Aerophobetes bacterium]
MKRAKVLMVVFLGIWIFTLGRGVICSDQKISVDFTDADLKTEVLPVISRLTGLSIVVAPDVEGKVTARFEEPRPVMDILRIVLEANNCQYERVDNFIKVTRISPSIRIFSLKYALAKEMIVLLSPFLSKEGRLEIDEEANVLTVKDYPSTLKKIE